MPLDRIIDLTIYAKGSFNNHGEYVPGAVTFQGGIWSERTDVDLEAIITEGGKTSDFRRTWRVRWDQDLYDAALDFLARVQVTENSLPFVTQSVIEDSTSQRRRYLLITGTHTPT